jgi:hypothetical protein
MAKHAESLTRQASKENAETSWRAFGVAGVANYFEKGKSKGSVFAVKTAGIPAPDAK